MMCKSLVNFVVIMGKALLFKPQGARFLSYGERLHFLGIASHNTFKFKEVML